MYMTSAVWQYSRAFEDALHTIISRNFLTSVRQRRRNNWIHTDSEVCLQWIIFAHNDVLLSTLLFTDIIHIFCIVNAFHPWINSHFCDICYPSLHWEFQTPDLLVLVLAAAHCISISFCLGLLQTQINCSTLFQSTKGQIIMTSDEWDTSRSPAAWGVVP